TRKRTWNVFDTHARRTPATPTLGLTGCGAAGCTGGAGGIGIDCQSGLMSSTSLFVTCAGDEPSAFIVQISSSHCAPLSQPPSGNTPSAFRSLKNAIFVPSGDQAGF